MSVYSIPYLWKNSMEENDTDDSSVQGTVSPGLQNCQLILHKISIQFQTCYNARKLHAMRQRVKHTKRLTSDSQTKDHLAKHTIFYKHLAQFTPEAIVIHQEGKIVYANRATVKLIGAKSAGEVIGQKVERFIHPDSLPLIKARIKNMLSKRKVAPFVEEKFLNFKGEVIIARTKAVPFTVEGKPAILAILHDVTKQKQAEERQKFLEHLSVLLGESIEYKTTLKNISKLLVPYLADYIRISLVDDANTLEDVVAYHVDPKQLLLVKKLYAAYKDRTDTKHGVNHILTSGKSEIIEKVTSQTAAYLKHNTIIQEIMKALHLTSYMGVPLKLQYKVIGAITFSSVRTNRLYTKEDLRFAEEIARRIAYAIENAKLYTDAQKAIILRNDFISLASHELKTPITSLKLYIQTLQRQCRKGKDFDVGSYLAKIEQQTDKLTLLVNDLLDIAKIQHGKLAFTMEAVDLNELIKDTIDVIKATAPHHMIRIEGTISKKVYADQYRISQVVINLLTNAIKYSPNAATVVVRLVSEKDFAVVTVQDFGIGIEPGEQKKIFNQFYRVENSQDKTFPGLGMGLYISYEIIKRHGGTMSVVSHTGKGSQFSFTLPYTH